MVNEKESVKRAGKKQVTKKTRKKGKITFKSYLRDFLIFAGKNLIKVTGILAIIAIILIALSLSSMVDVARQDECVGACRDAVTFGSNLWNKIQIILVMIVAGIVPYMYAPVIGFLGYILQEVSTIAYVIKGYGYGIGLLLGILPLILNILIACIVTALGIYMCRTVTVGYKISNVKNMNFTNFRIKLYETIGKEKRAQELTEKKNKKLEKLETVKQKLNYIQILNTGIVVCILQVISAVVEAILL